VASNGPQISGTTSGGGQTSPACKNGVGSGGAGVGRGYILDLGAAIAGESSTGGVGGGVSAIKGPSLGAYASGGAPAYAGSHSAGVPTQSSDITFVLGAYAGAGANINFTNAALVQQLSGPFTTISGNVGLGIANRYRRRGKPQLGGEDGACAPGLPFGRYNGAFNHTVSVPVASFSTSSVPPPFTPPLLYALYHFLRKPCKP
jgi:hypothetical protein